MRDQNRLKLILLGSLLLSAVFSGPALADGNAVSTDQQALPKRTISFGISYFTNIKEKDYSGSSYKSTSVGPTFDMAFRILEQTPLYVGGEVDFMLNPGIDIGFGSGVSTYRLNVLPYVLYRFQSNSVFTPFVGVGLGVSHFFADKGSSYPSDTSVLLQTKMGFDIGRKWAFRFEPSIGMVSSQFVFAPRFAASVSW